MKTINLEDFYKVDKLLSDAEEIMRGTRVDDECYLINHIRSYIRMKRTK